MTRVSAPGRRVRGPIVSLLLLAGTVGLGPESLPAQDATPRAGEAYSGRFLGIPIDVPARDRRELSWVGGALLSVPGGPDDHREVPAGELFLWRNHPERRELLRAEIAIVANSIRYNRGVSSRGWEGVGTLETSTLPWSFSDSIEGVRDTPATLKFRSVRGGLGIGWRRGLAPGLQDNFVEAALTFEPGYLWFSRTGETASDFVLPADSFESRAHLRIRADALVRNLLELPHEGWAAGLDARAGDRSGWKDWGGGASGEVRAADGRRWTSISGYILAASPLPFTAGERHRAIVSAYAATGSGLDRFSAPRLDGFSNAGDWESLSRPVVPGAAADEFRPTRYAVANFEYRYQAAFFLYLQARGTLAWVDRARRNEDGGLRTRMESLPAVTAAVTTGLPWRMSMELAWSRNFGVLRSNGAGRTEKGGNALYASLTKSLP